MAVVLRVLCYCLVLAFAVPGYAKNDPNFVTYEFSGGRFGDNLIAYLHAKWISYKYQIPLLYKPFPYSTELVLDDCEQLYSSKGPRSLQNVSLTEVKEIVTFSNKHSKVYICPYFPECQWERVNLFGPHGKPWWYFNVDWTDREFRQLIKKLIAPKHPCNILIPPKETVNIAIHLRDGGSYDQGDFALFFITKFPPLDFYIEGLLKVIELFPDQMLYCYLFTDAEKPDLLIEKIKSKIPAETSIIFDCRSENNGHDRNVIEDFFSLVQFDVLIHSQSNFSVVPPLIHDYAIEYAPLSGKREGSVTWIDRVKFNIDEILYEELLLK